MAYSIQNVIDDLSAVIHGTNVNKLTNLYGLLNRAGRKVLGDLDPKELQRTATISSPIYADVFSYPLPADVKDDAIFDIYPTGKRTAGDKYDQRFNREFDIYKKQGNFAIKYVSGTKVLDLSRVGGPMPAVVNQLNATTGFSVGGDASALTTNNLYQIAGGASIQFDLSGATGIGYIETTTSLAVDISTLVDDGAFFLYTYLPTSAITSIAVRIGSSSTDYYSGTATSQQNSVSFEQGWNLTQYTINQMTTTGSPDATDITYIRITINYPIGTPISGVRVNNLTAQLGEIFESDYYSKYLFRSSAGTWKENTDDTTDLVNLDTTSYNIYFNCVAELAQQQLSGQPANFDIGYFATQYQTDLKRYKQLFKSERIKPQAIYYRMPTRRRTRRIYT